MKENEFSKKVFFEFSKFRKCFFFLIFSWVIRDQNFDKFIWKFFYRFSSKLWDLKIAENWNFSRKIFFRIFEIFQKNFFADFFWILKIQNFIRFIFKKFYRFLSEIRDFIIAEIWILEKKFFFSTFKIFRKNCFAIFFFKFSEFKIPWDLSKKYLFFSLKFENGKFLKIKKNFEKKNFFFEFFRAPYGVKNSEIITQNHFEKKIFFREKIF